MLTVQDEAQINETSRIIFNKIDELRDPYLKEALRCLYNHHIKMGTNYFYCSEITDLWLRALIPIHFYAKKLPS